MVTLIKSYTSEGNLMNTSSIVSIKFFISNVVGEEGHTESLLDYIKESSGVDLFEDLNSEFKSNGLEVGEWGAYGDIHYTIECDPSEVLDILSKMENISEKFFRQYPLEQAYTYFESQLHTNLSGVESKKYHQTKRVYEYLTKRLFR